MADIKATQTSKTDEWETPAWLTALLEDEFGSFSLDPCATAQNKKAEAHYSLATNGLSRVWWGLTFVNPPYSEIAAWVEKSHNEALMGHATVLLLIAARTDTRWWWRFVRKGEVRLIQGRIKFGLSGMATTVSAPFPSALVVFQRNLERYSPSTLYWDLPQGLRR